jgi:hypothetical protein
LKKTADHTSKSQSKVVFDATTGGYSPIEVQQFQTSFWVAIAFIIAAFGAIYTLVKMDMLYDSIIYKTTDGPKPIPDVQ